jgi:MFS family permease
VPLDDRRLLTPTFLIVTGSALSYFVAIGIVAPVLPVYVKDDLGGTGAAVGVVVGAFAVAAAILRPVSGRIGDRQGRRILLVGGSLIFALSVLAYGLVDAVPWLVAMRILSGVGEAAVFVGAATMAQDLAPAHRRGEAASYFSVAIYGGLGIGPPLGEAVLRAWGTGEVWLVAAGFGLLAATLGLAVPRSVGGAVVTDPAGSTGSVDGGPEVSRASAWKRRVFHPAAVGPGVILMLATAGLAAFIAFMPLYARDLGLGGSGGVFLLYSALVLGVRIGGARLGTTTAASAALLLQAGGFVLMGLWATVIGLYVSTGLYALGVSLMYPSLLPLVIDAAPDAERSQAVGTFTLFFDVAQGGGGLLFGLVVSVGGNRSAFVLAGVLCMIGFAVLHRGPVGRRRPATLPATGPDPRLDRGTAV